jgi:hypothetical protein
VDEAPFEQVSNDERKERAKELLSGAETYILVAINKLGNPELMMVTKNNCEGWALCGYVWTFADGEMKMKMAGPNVEQN